RRPSEPLCDHPLAFPLSIFVVVVSNPDFRPWTSRVEYSRGEGKISPGCSNKFSLRGPSSSRGVQFSCAARTGPAGPTAERPRGSTLRAEELLAPTGVEVL